MQKQLITDQLSDTLDMILGKALKDKELAENISIKPQLEGRIETLDEVITLIQSLRQQEVQNVIDAYHTARIDSISHDWYPEKHAKEYFTQTFEQKGGGNDELRKP